MTTIDSETNIITVAGDWHGNIDQACNVVKYAYQNNSDTIIQVGDFGIWKGDGDFLDDLQDTLDHMGIAIYFVDGNNENFPRLYRHPLDLDTGFRPIRPSIHHIPRGARFTINDIRFLGLGGAYSVDRQWRKRNVSYWEEETVTPEEIDYILSAPDKTTDILIMHDSPYPAPNPITDNPVNQVQGQRTFGFETIKEANRHRTTLTPVFIAAQPHILFHGHYHAFWTGQYVHESGRLTRVVALDEGAAPLRQHAAILDLNQLKTELNGATNS